MRLRTAFLTLLLSAMGQAVCAQDAQPQVQIVLGAKELGDLNKVLTEDIPARWAQPVADWMNKLLQQAAEKRKAEAAKPADPVDPPKPESKP